MGAYYPQKLKKSLALKHFYNDRNYYNSMKKCIFVLNIPIKQALIKAA